jgi:NAD(P)-dependent dehydrogenase (short-subunit alcohol dehydrogenase family)
MALILVTGTGTGLGQASARELIDLVHADLADLDATVDLAGRLNRIGTFDAVIHNAGVLNGPDVFAVNIVAPYVLSALMTPPSRTVTLSSSMHLTGSAELEALDFARPQDRRRPYDDSKLHVTALAMALARLRPNALAHAVDPGWVPTRMGGPHASDDLDEGHRTQVWLATADADEIAPRSGGYWHHRVAGRPHPAAVDAEFQRALMERLAVHAGVTFS